MSKLIYQMGRETFCGIPTPPHALHLNGLIESLIRGETTLRLKSRVTLVRVTDPLEDADDTAAILLDDRILASSGIKMTYILSGGFHSPEMRLEFLQTILPGLQFGVEYKNYLTVFPDGHIMTTPFDGLLMAGPCHTTTFRSLCETVQEVAVFVGTEGKGLLDPSKPAPVNCKKTDTDGVLTPDADAWNLSVQSMLNDTSRGVMTLSLPPEVGRHICLPADFLDPILEDQLVRARLLQTSRPPAVLGARLHVANCTLMGSKWPEPEFNEERFAHGAAVADAYLEQAKQKLSPKAVEELLIPVTFATITAALWGAVYLPERFGSPIKDFTAYLTPDSIEVYTASVKGFPTPMYDVGGMVLLLSALCII